MVDRQRLFHTVIDVLGDAVMTDDAVRAAIVEQGDDVGQPDRFGIDDLGRVLQLRSSFAHVGGGIVHTPSLMRGIEWSLPVDAEDAENEYVTAEPHLAPLLGWLIDGNDDDMAITAVDGDGSELGRVETDGLSIDGVDTDVVTWPDGALAPLADRWATVTIVDDRTVCVAASNEPTPPSDEQIAAIRVAFDASADVRIVTPMIGDEVEIRTTSLAALTTEMVVVDVDAFRGNGPVPSIDALIAAAGLEVNGRLVGAEGSDWAALKDWQRLKRIEFEHGFDDEQARSYLLLVGATTVRDDDGELLLGDTDEERAGALTLIARILEDAPVAEAVWDHWADEDLLAAPLQEVIEELETLFDDAPLSGYSWLRARRLAAVGETEQAVAILERALASDHFRGHAGVLCDLAAIEADRSNPAAAQQLLDRAGVDTDIDLDDEFDPLTAQDGFGRELAEEIAPFAAVRPRPMAGRNDRCPCGSGRKYKHCHLGNELHPIDQRAGWLYVKMMRFLHLVSPHFPSVIADDIIDEVADPTLRDMLFRSYLPSDLALHEGGLAELFVDAKRTLLPADELSMAEAWIASTRSVYEVQQSAADSMEVIDLATRETMTVRDTVPEEPLDEGWKLIGRLLPVTDHHQAYGGFLPINDDMVDVMLEGFSTRKLETVAVTIGGIFETAEAQNELDELLREAADPSQFAENLQRIADEMAD